MPGSLIAPPFVHGLPRQASAYLTAASTNSWRSASEQGTDPFRERDRPPHRIIERPPVLGEVEVLDAQHAVIAELVETPEHRREIDHAGGIVGVHRGGAGLALT